MKEQEQGDKPATQGEVRVPVVTSDGGAGRHGLKSRRRVLGQLAWARVVMTRVEIDLEDV